MAEGVRLHHPTLRGCTYTLVHFGRPLGHVFTCMVCGVAHHHKTYHLALDASGDVTVSEGVFVYLRDILDELEVLGVDHDPPPQFIRPGMARPHVVAREAVRA